MKSKAQKNKILIILPTLGQRTDFLRKTLDSIKLQKPVNYDLVMIFPKNSKETESLAKEFGAIIVEDHGKGLSSAVNEGLKQLKPIHKYFSWIGDDDLLSEKSLHNSQKALEENGEAVVAFGYCDYINNAGEKLFTNRTGNLAPWIMTWGPNLMPCPGTLFRCSAVKEAGQFDVNNKYSMDLDMFLRLRKLGKFINTKKTLAAFRWHSSSTTVANRKAVLKETESVKRKYLPKYLQTIAPIWEYPVRIATKLAVIRVNKLSNLNGIN